MHEIIHGGDIYQNKVDMDFSVNINPFGIPNRVREALLEAVSQCMCYPDIHARKLTSALSESLRVSPEQIICGNGASELFMAAIHALGPKQILIPVPSFYGYEKVAEAACASVIYYRMKESDGFALTDDFLDTLSEEIDLVFLANPNNPVGNTIEEELMLKICERCRMLHITLVVDECFIEFTDAKSLVTGNRLETYQNVIIVRAFTKIYAIPGARLGYLICGNQDTCKKICTQLPEWNLSTFAQAAGVTALREKVYVEQTVDYVQKERAYLSEALIKKGITVWPGRANFLMFYCEYPLYEKLLEQGILIRDCGNYRGLKKGFYRIAVKSHEENKKLIEMVGELLERN